MTVGNGFALIGVLLLAVRAESPGGVVEPVNRLRAFEVAPVERLGKASLPERCSATRRDAAGTASHTARMSKSVSLAGLITNNSIVLIDQIDIERKSAGLTSPILNVAVKRIRSILLTSVMTVFGLMPLFLFGGPMWELLAAVIVGGLSVASAITLFFAPAAFQVLRPTDHSSERAELSASP